MQGYSFPKKTTVLLEFSIEGKKTFSLSLADNTRLVLSASDSERVLFPSIPG